MAPGSSDKADRSYLSTAVDSINPWNSSRTTAPASGQRHDGGPSIPRPTETATPGDHSTTPFYGQSFRSYAPDCPSLSVRWFHAVDIPKRKPQLVKGRQATRADTKAPTQPKKFSAFSASDSRRIEGRYQRLLELAEDGRSQTSGLLHQATVASRAPSAHDTIPSKHDARVPVNEDFLFDVDIEERELSPVYWLGPVYEVRRGTWFFQEGSNIRPCEENLAAQLEEGYLKLKPWLHPVRARSQSGSKNTTSEPGEESPSTAQNVNSKPPQTSSTTVSRSQSPFQPPSYRLFGTYMNNIATYQDATTAWLSSDSMLSWVTTSYYERFAGGGYMSGLKLTRGYVEPNKSKEMDEKDSAPQEDDSLPSDERQRKSLKRRSAPPMTRPMGDDQPLQDEIEPTVSGVRDALLQRQISSLIESGDRGSTNVEEDIRRRDEQEIQDDYNARAGETQGREIEHLVLVTHGIGQRLGLRMESVNFVHDVNVLRKTFKSVYTNSIDLKALNSEFGMGPGNCRVQVLPVCWRHLLEFPRRRERRVEHDLADTTGEEDDYPSLEDITIEGVAFARSLMADLALDVLLYQSSYREEISSIVLEESNRIFNLFMERNPEFKGKVHFMGHSLGSAILFDVLCRQKQRRTPDEPKSTLRFWTSRGHREPEATEELALDFDVEDFYCLGSPIGLFQMLRGRTIAARHSLRGLLPPEISLHADSEDDAFVSPADPSVDTASATAECSRSVSSPKVEQLFNIFHPSDPISYRLEPLISPAMAALKPQLLPYTKKGIFGSVAPQGLTGFGAKVGQSVSGLWSSFSAGIASNLLRSSLKLSNDEMTQMSQQQQTGMGSDPPIGEVLGSSESHEMNDQHAQSTTGEGYVSIGGGNKTLSEDEVETLYSRFQKKRMGFPKEGQAEKSHEESRKARKLHVEEGKMRALNRNGRVDYSIQESALDFNPINTIASHMGYWADEDVSHFILSQLLSNQARVRIKQ